MAIQVAISEPLELAEFVPRYEINPARDASRAHHMLNVWASVKWHRISGCAGTPLMDWLYEEQSPDRFISLVKSGQRWLPFCGDPDEWDRLVKKHPENTKRLDLALDRSSSKDSKLTAARVAELSVSNALHSIGASRLVEALLIHRRPDSGPYARTEHQRCYRAFRPEGFYLQVGMRGLRSEVIEKKLDALLGSWERAVVDQVAGVWRI